jgi:hypothetical protein
MFGFQYDAWLDRCRARRTCPKDCPDKPLCKYLIKISVLEETYPMISNREPYFFERSGRTRALIRTVRKKYYE